MIESVADVLRENEAVVLRKKVIHWEAVLYWAASFFIHCHSRNRYYMRMICLHNASHGIAK